MLLNKKLFVCIANCLPISAQDLTNVVIVADKLFSLLLVLGGSEGLSRR